MFEVGMKVLIIGAHTEHGRQYVGRQVVIHQLPLVGEVFDPAIISPLPGLPDNPQIKNRMKAVAIVFGDIVSGGIGFIPGYAAFSQKHLMPLPPLKDTGIDDHTFTPIENKELIGA